MLGISFNGFLPCFANDLVPRRKASSQSELQRMHSLVTGVQILQSIAPRE